jgi:glycosyltransferase involved in cell wall biosynthesis
VWGRPVTAFIYIDTAVVSHYIVSLDPASRKPDVNAGSVPVVSVFGFTNRLARGLSAIIRGIMSQLRVLHLSYSDVQGGAARAAYRLHTGLRPAGIDSHMLVARREASDHTVSALAGPLGHFAARCRARLPGRSKVLTDDRGRYGGRALHCLLPCDILHLHWVAHLFDQRTFFSGLPGMPIVWTLHDANPFTGGCHVTLGCRHFEQRCGRCPQLEAPANEDASRAIWKRKEESYRHVKERLTIVTPSRWLCAMAEKSSLLSGCKIVCIPNGLDTSAFTPGDRAAARHALGLPVNARIVLFLAHSLEAEWKGFRCLLEAMEALRDRIPRLFLLTCGRSDGSLKAPVAHSHKGIVDGETLVNAYRAADVAAVPSLWDNSPNAVIEALACGIPVAAFATGGIPEMISDGETGVLAPPGDIAGLTEALATLLTGRRSRARMSELCRRATESNHDLARQASRYADLYRTLLSEQASV